MERACGQGQMHVPLRYSCVEDVELALLLLLLCVGPDDTHAGEVLLDHRGEGGELLLDLLEAAVDDLAEAQHHRGEDDHGDHGVRGEPRTDVEHEGQREREAHQRVHRVHHRRPRRHAHGQRVVGGPAHEIARAHRAVERRVEAHQVTEEVVAQVRLDVATDAVQQLAHSVPGRSSQEGRQHDEGGQHHDAAPGHVGLAHAVDGELHEIGAGDLEDVGHHHEDHPPHESLHVGAEVWQDAPEFAHARNLLRSAARPVAVPASGREASPRRSVWGLVGLVAAGGRLGYHWAVGDIGSIQRPSHAPGPTAPCVIPA